MVGRKTKAKKSQVIGEQVAELEAELPGALADFEAARDRLATLAIRAAHTSSSWLDTFATMRMVQGTSVTAEDLEFEARLGELGQQADLAWQELHQPIIGVDDTRPPS
jgi:hypothetical protein